MFCYVKEQFKSSTHLFSEEQTTRKNNYFVATAPLSEYNISHTEMVLTCQRVLHSAFQIHSHYVIDMFHSLGQGYLKLSVQLVIIITVVMITIDGVSAIIFPCYYDNSFLTDLI